MVFFSCDKCAEMLKKNKVDAHAMRCGCDSVSCVDCGVSFWGDDYKLHTSCVTEAERYEKTIYKGPRKNDTKGRKLTPQEAWMEVINESMSSCAPAISSYLETLSTCDNVPRKEKAFRNFASNSLKLRGAKGEDIVSSLWKHLQAVRKKKSEAQEEQAKAKLKKEEISKVSEEQGGSQRKDQKKTTSTRNGMYSSKKDKSKDKKKKTVVKAMKKILKKAPSQQMKMKEFRKLVKERLETKDSKIGKDELKEVIIKIIDDESSIALDGKMVKLTQ